MKTDQTRRAEVFITVNTDGLRMSFAEHGVDVAEALAKVVARATQLTGRLTPTSDVDD